MKIEMLFKRPHGKQERKHHHHRYRKQELGDDKDDDSCKEKIEDDYFKKLAHRGQRMLQERIKDSDVMRVARWYHFRCGIYLSTNSISSRKSEMSWF